jgi:hypothetical protein
VLDAASSGGDTEGHGDVAADPEIEALDDAGEDAAASRATAAAADVTEQATDAPAMILTSSPSGATVALDGRRLGRTPYRYDGGVGGRQYRVSYTLEGYEETSVGGVFPGEGTVTVRATLQPVAEPATDGDLPDVSAAVSPATVDAIVGSNAAVRRCVTQATDRGDALPARVWIKFTVHDDGHISGTYTLSPELSGSETERCLAQQVNGLRFGPFTGAQTKTVKFYLDAP